ncbi:hypothetical protein ACMB9K_001555 [Escherichia coli]|nr:hypothetical protein [Escherichia coli]EET8935490.1 hypothetical protein [Escherichia coli]EEW9050737.1 hypothetical protein [Escherichia coli]EEW9477333.1 hypothetical protein [Escherichia coli]EEX6108766.1 hypothetical protein [Escherichia coli]
MPKRYPTADTEGIELQPDSPRHDEEALKVSGLSLEYLQQNGQPPLEAMKHLDKWLCAIKKLKVA